MAQGNTAKFSVAKLTDTNYQPWKFKVKMLLIREGTWKCVQDDVPNNPDDDWIALDQKAQSTISLSIDDSQIIHVYKCETEVKYGESYRRCMNVRICATNCI